MSSAPNESTSEPIYKAAASVGAGVTALLGVLGGAVALGVISSSQADAYTAAGTQLVSALPQLAAAIAGVAAIVSGLAGAFVTAWQARKKAVPIDSDRFQIVPTAPPTGGVSTGQGSADTGPLDLH